MKFSSLLMAAVGLVATVASPLTAADLEQIRAELRELQSSVDAIRVAYVAEAPLRIECELLVSGDKARLTTFAPETGPTWDSFDGKTGYQIGYYDLTAASDVRTIRKFNSVPPNITGEHSPLKWFGLEMVAQDQPLHEMLARGRITGDALQEEWPVVEVDLGEWPTTRGPSRRYWCRLSSQHGFAPAMILNQAAGDKAAFVYRVDEFRQIDDPLLKKKIWFPWRMSAGRGDAEGLNEPLMKFETTSVDLHPTVTPADFEPSPEPGVMLVDERKPGGRMITVHEPAKARKRVMRHIPDPPAAGAVPFVADPDRGISAAWYWLLGTFVLLGVAWGVRRSGG